MAHELTSYSDESTSTGIPPRCMKIEAVAEIEHRSLISSLWKYMIHVELCQIYVAHPNSGDREISINGGDSRSRLAI